MRKTKRITANHKQVHFFKGTSGTLTMHCKELVNVDDLISFDFLSDKILRVERLVETKRSNYHPNHRFYELKFSLV